MAMECYIDLTGTDSELEFSDTESEVAGLQGRVFTPNGGGESSSDSDVECLGATAGNNIALKHEIEEGEGQVEYNDSDSDLDFGSTPADDASDVSDIDSSADEFYDDDHTLPVYQWTKPSQHYSIEELAELLVTDTVSTNKICSKQPVRVCRNVSFVVDLHSLDDPLDIRADENGVWQRKGAPVAYISVHTSSGKTRVFKRSRMGNYLHHYKLTRTYYRHSCSPDFTRIITVAHDAQGQLQRYAFVQYSFDRHEHPIDLKPHGNSKGKKPFTRTKPSTIRLLKSSMAAKPPRKALREVENMMGGVMGATSACDLPRNRQQIHNLKYSAKNPPNLPSTNAGPRSDVLAHVMQLCKETSSSDATFIRSVEAAPEPMCVLATDQQLLDIERFCTGNPSSVLSIDPTFNLGPFNVTPTTYRNLLVETTKGNNPIVLGPILIHQTKTFRPFHYFASTLIRLNPQLLGLRAYGTDGEPELIKAFSICFPKAVHLRCTNHIRQNIKDKLRTLQVPQSISKEFLADVFGARIGSHFESGLADCETEASFTKSLNALKAKWNNLERSCNPCTTTPQFHDWFCRFKADEISKCVLPQVRRQAGCADPTRLFTTNTSESMNHLIKQEVEWHESNLPQLIESLKSLVDGQNSDLKNAIVGRGEWHFAPQFESLVVTERRWFSEMSDDAKKRHLSKVNSLRPFNAHPQSTSTLGAHTSQSTKESGTTPQKSVLSVPVEQCGVTNLANATLRNMWAKAEKLVMSKGHVMKVPWSDDAKARLVKSSTSMQPHLVTTDPKNPELFCCDKNCPMFKGFSVCSHVIATAQDNGSLRSFLDGVNRVCGPNLTAIASQGMPAGAGRKGGAPKRKRSRKLPAIETRSVRPCLTENDPTVARSCSSLPLSPPPVANPVASRSLTCPTPIHSGMTATHTRSSQHSIDPRLTGSEPTPITVAGPLISLASSSPPVANPASFITSHNSLTCPTPIYSGMTATHTRTSQCSVHPRLTGTEPMPATVAGPITFAPLSSPPTSCSPADVVALLGGLTWPASASAPSGTTATAASQGPVIVGGNVVNLAVSSRDPPALSTPPVFTSATCSSSKTRGNQSKKPFVLKLKTKLIKVCQSCRKNFDGTNDTLGLVVAHPERRLVSNLTTGVQFLSKESNSHYHLHMTCLRAADPTFQGKELVVPEEVRNGLTTYQRLYLSMCFQITL